MLLFKCNVKLGVARSSCTLSYDCYILLCNCLVIIIPLLAVSVQLTRMRNLKNIACTLAGSVHRGHYQTVLKYEQSRQIASQRIEWVRATRKLPFCAKHQKAKNIDADALYIFLSTKNSARVSQFPRNSRIVIPGEGRAENA